MRRFIYSTKKVNKQPIRAFIDGEYFEPDDTSDLYVVKIWHESDPGSDVAAPVAAEEIFTIRANSPDQAKEYAKMQWSGPIDRIEIVDVNPEGYEEEVISSCGGASIMSSSRSYADNKKVEDGKRAKMYRVSLYPQYDEKRIEDLLTIDWNDVVARDSEDFLKDTVDFPDLAEISAVRYADDDEMIDLESQGYDGAYIVTFVDGTEVPAAWKSGSDDLDVVSVAAEPVESCGDVLASDNIAAAEEISFKEWLRGIYGDGFDPSGLSDEEFWDLEDQYRAEVPREQREFNYR